MRIEDRTKVVHYNVYIANDGREFETESACRDYEKRLNGERKTCEFCGGKGYISEGWHDVRNELTCQYERVEYTHKCPKCDGKGYLERKEVWS